MLAVRHLATHGWQPIVLTLDDASPGRVVEQKWEGVRIIRVTPTSKGWRRAHRNYRRVHTSRGYRRLAWRLIGRCLCAHDRFAPAQADLIRVAEELNHSSRFRAVASQYHPVDSHHVGRALAERWRVPWIATTKDFFSWPDEQRPVSVTNRRNLRRRVLESRLLESADAVLSINDHMTTYLSGLVSGQPVATWAHCFDDRTPAAPALSPPTRHATGPFHFVSVGLVDHHDEAGLISLFEAARHVIDSGQLASSALRLRFVGHGHEVVQRAARLAELPEILQLVPPVDHASAVSEMHRADCLLFQQVAWGSRRRLADYFGSGRPILAWPEYPQLSGVTSQPLLTRYGAAHLGGDTESLAQLLVQLVRSGHQDCPTVNLDLVEEFTSTTRGGEFASFLDNALLTHRNF